MNPEIYTSSAIKKQQTRVLIVDDNPDHWLIMQSALQHFLPQVQSIWAGGLKEGLNYLDACVVDGQQPPKMILLDLYLPTCEQGWQLLRMIREHPRYQHTPVIVLSSSDDPSDIRGTYQNGGTSYIVKPTGYPQWLDYFQTLKTYWWDSVTLPKRNA